MFDIILTRCNKPHWFKIPRPMRLLDTHTGQIKWSHSVEYKKGSVFVEGSMDVRYSTMAFLFPNTCLLRNQLNSQDGAAIGYCILVITSLMVSSPILPSPAPQHKNSWNYYIVEYRFARTKSRRLENRSHHQRIGRGSANAEFPPLQNTAGLHIGGCVFLSILLSSPSLPNTFLLQVDNALKKLMFLRGWEVKRAIAELKAHRNQIRSCM